LENCQFAKFTGRKRVEPMLDFQGDLNGPNTLVVSTFDETVIGQTLQNSSCLLEERLQRLKP